jgi:hypothetical protein
MKKLVLLAAIAGTLAVPTTALANGPCGQNFDGNHACGVNSPAVLTGSLITDNEDDYYVFHGTVGTELQVSVTNTIDPGCWISSSCGSVRAVLTDSQGSEVSSTSSSYPNNGIAIPASLNHTLDAKGNYYLILSGQLADDANNQETVAVPYTLSVSASPNVRWPAPAPYTVKHCTTRKVRRFIHHRWHRVKITTCRRVTIFP